MKTIKGFFTGIAVMYVLAFSICAVEISDFSQITDMNGTYELTGDVTLISEFSPIGSESKPFTGSFDGKAHKVSGSYSSIFAYTDGANIKNIKAEASLVSDTYFGGIVAVAEGKTVVEGCTFSGSVTVDDGGMYNIGGGIAGFAAKDTVIRNCGADVTLTVSDNPYELTFGGIAGVNEGSVKYCYSGGALTASSDKYKVSIGGISGVNSGCITGCFNEADIDGSITKEASQMFAGGITGINRDGVIERAGNLGNVNGNGYSVYPAYAGGIAGMNLNGKIDMAKNSAGISALHSFAGGIAGFSLGHKKKTIIADALNMGVVSGLDSVTGGIVSANTVTAEDGSEASIEYALNINSNKAVAENQGETSEIYNMGEADGVSTTVTVDGLKKDGIPALEKHDGIWVNNTEISALPDMLVVRDERTAQLIASNTGDGGDVAYYLYSPDASGYAKAFTAVYFNGSRYLSMDYVEKAPTEMYARLKATDIPEGTTRIKFIAFSETFGVSFKPAEVLSTEIAYTK